MSPTASRPGDPPGPQAEQVRPKKCGHMGGKVLVPTQEAVQKLTAARLAADILGVPSVLFARTDAEAANLLTSDIDENDRPFCTGERSAEGYFRVLDYSMFDLARGYVREHMTAYVKLQQAEFAAESLGYSATKHQREVGTGYFDDVMQAVQAGRSSVTALTGSTEEQQFA